MHQESQNDDKKREKIYFVAISDKSSIKKFNRESKIVQS